MYWKILITTVNYVVISCTLLTKPISYPPHERQNRVAWAYPRNHVIVKQAFRLVSRYMRYIGSPHISSYTQCAIETSLIPVWQVLFLLRFWQKARAYATEQPDGKKRNYICRVYLTYMRNRPQNWWQGCNLKTAWLSGFVLEPRCLSSSLVCCRICVQTHSDLCSNFVFSSSSPGPTWGQLTIYFLILYYFYISWKTWKLTG